MKVENINSSSIYNVNSNKNSGDDNSAAKASGADSINISSKAKELAKQNEEEKLTEIKEKMSNNYYSKKEVLEATAKAILKDIES